MSARRDNPPSVNKTKWQGSFRLKKNASMLSTPNDPAKNTMSVDLGQAWHLVKRAEDGGWTCKFAACDFGQAELNSTHERSRN
jgi:hypothetical protein